MRTNTIKFSQKNGGCECSPCASVKIESKCERRYKERCEAPHSHLANSILSVYTQQYAIMAAFILGANENLSRTEVTI